MKHIQMTAAALLALALFGVEAGANPRTFVSRGGTDVGSCTRFAPCRSLFFAMGLTDPGGELVILDSGGYGGLTIGQSVTIVAPPGVHAGVSVSSGNGITVNAAATDVVILRGLVLTGSGGDNGIRLMRARAVHIENCEISGFVDAGIFHDGTFPINVFIIDSVVRDNEFGIFANAQNTAASATRFEISRSRIAGNAADGMLFSDILRVVIADSVIARNANGLDAAATATSSLNPRIAIDRTAIVDNGTGVRALGATHTAFVSLSASVVAGNVLGLTAVDSASVVIMTSQVNGNATGSSQLGAGVVNTLGNNLRYGNGSTGTPTLISPE